MINIFFKSNSGETSRRNRLLTTVLDLYSIPYRIIGGPDSITGDAVITDCFVEQVYSKDSEISKSIIDRCASQNVPIMFYYPSECESTMSSSYYPTRDYVAGRIPIYLVKQGNRDVDGFTHHNLDTYFAWTLTREFNQARLTYTSQRIESESKPYRFLFLNGTRRPIRERMFDILRERNLLDQSIHSFIDYRMPDSLPEDIKPVIDWPQPNIHEDFRFENFYPPHFWSTEFTLALETAPKEIFITEKILKSCLVGHPFITLCGQGALAHLRSLGFQTFDPVIDESYDNIEFEMERVEAVAKEVERLCRQGVDVIAETKSQRQHNRMVMYQLSEQVYWDLFQIIISVFPQYQTADYVNLPNLSIQNLGHSVFFPVGELLDRLTIAELKVERIGPECQPELDYYNQQASQIDLSNVQDLIAQLKQIHSQIWGLEASLKANRDGEESLELIGQRAREIRDYNSQRVKLKNKIAERLNSTIFEYKKDHRSSH